MSSFLTIRLNVENRNQQTPSFRDQIQENIGRVHLFEVNEERLPAGQDTHIPELSNKRKLIPVSSRMT